jgi:hypothetical protein
MNRASAVHSVARQGIVRGTQQMYSRRPMRALLRNRTHPISWFFGACTAVIAMVLIGALGITQAAAYPAHVNKLCKRDYYKFCSAYSVGTPKLHRCMESKRRSLSRRCIDALKRARLIPRRYL